MSSCWKCGRPLPEGQVECEDDCQPQAYRELMALKPKLPTFQESAAARRPESIMIQVNLNVAAIAANPARFDIVMLKFMQELERITMSSGLHEFTQNKPPGA